MSGYEDEIEIPVCPQCGWKNAADAAWELKREGSSKTLYLNSETCLEFFSKNSRTDKEYYFVSYTSATEKVGSNTALNNVFRVKCLNCSFVSTDSSLMWECIDAATRLIGVVYDVRI